MVQRIARHLFRADDDMTVAEATEADTQQLNGCIAKRGHALEVVRSALGNELLHFQRPNQKCPRGI